MSENIVLKMSNISKTFPGVKALSNVDFTLREGEIHALMGENGAGKSTLIKVLTGVHDFQTGEIYMVKNAGGKPELIVNHSPQEAQQNGISTVYQEVNLCPNLTVAENLFIGREPRRFGMIDWRTMNRKSAEVLKKSRYPCGTNSEFGRVFLGNSANDSNCQSCGYEMPSFNFG